MRTVDPLTREEIRQRRANKRRKMFAVLPTLLTLGNVVCGFGSITFAAKVGLATQTGWGKTDSDYLFIAGLLIFLAMVFDMLDGRAARWAKQSSQFGAELDSLCDAISFGVAPAFILVKFATNFNSRLLWVIATLYVVCAVLRLARFNVETDEEDSHDAFSGLPSPAAAGTIASFMIAFPTLAHRAAPLVGEPTIWQEFTHRVAVVLVPMVEYGLPVIAFGVAALMVSRLRYPHVFNQLFRGRRNFQHLILIIVGIAIAFMVRELALPVMFCYFAFGAPSRALWNFLMGRQPGITPPSSGVPEVGLDHANGSIETPAPPTRVD